jgi:hypothetical protein
MQIVLTHNATNFTKVYLNIEDISRNPLFYEFEINTDELVDGDYSLTLLDDSNNKLSNTIVKIGKYNTSRIAYNVDKKYITYNG